MELRYLQYLKTSYVYYFSFQLDLNPSSSKNEQ